MIVLELFARRSLPLFPPGNSTLLKLNSGLPTKYYLIIVHSRGYIYNSLSLPFNDSQFIYT